MQLVPIVTHLDGIVTVAMDLRFVGNTLDSDDQARVQAYGDPLVNLAGTFTDPADPTFFFSTAANELWVKMTQEMRGFPGRFMVVMPNPRPGERATFAPGPLDVITIDPVRAAGLWATAIQDRCNTAISALRLKTPVKLTSLPTRTV
jgi:hypothetical protein